MNKLTLTDNEIELIFQALAILEDDKKKAITDLHIAMGGATEVDSNPETRGIYLSIQSGIDEIKRLEQKINNATDFDSEEI